MDRPRQGIHAGAELRDHRIAAGASIAQVARAWPYSSTNVQLIEGAAHVTQVRVGRYSNALAESRSTASEAEMLRTARLALEAVDEKLPAMAAPE